MKELVNILTLKYPKINSNIISKRIKIYNHLIEFKGAPKTGGYYLKKQDQLDKQQENIHSILMYLIKSFTAGENSKQ